MQPRPTGRQLLNQFADMVRTMWHRPPVADLATLLALRNRDRDSRLVDIKPDEHAILHVVSPPFLRLGASQSDATLERRMPRERPQTQSAHTAIMGSRDGRLATCPPVVEYGREFQARAVEELARLPEGSMIAEMPSNYNDMREQARAYE